jgi:hypothetical protein
MAYKPPAARQASRVASISGASLACPRIRADEYDLHGGDANVKKALSFLLKTLTSLASAESPLENVSDPNRFS